jgi:hypothetical protein
MPYPSRILDTDALSIAFDDHVESLYLGPWKELTVGNLRLIRREDDTIEVQRTDEDFGSL